MGVPGLRELRAGELRAEELRAEELRARHLLRVLLDELVREIEELGVVREAHHRAEVGRQHLQPERVERERALRQRVAAREVAVLVLVLGRHAHQLDVVVQRRARRGGRRGGWRGGARRARGAAVCRAARRAVVGVGGGDVHGGEVSPLARAELAAVIEAEPLGVRPAELRLELAEEALLLLGREHVVRHEAVERLGAKGLRLERGGVAARRERPVLLELVHRALEQLHRRVHPHLPLDPAAVRVRDDLKHVVAEQREALVPLLRLRQALGGQVAEARLAGR